MTTVAIVAQKPDVVIAFLRENPLPFRVLIDESRDVLRAYGVWHRLGLDAWNIARPAVFLIARDGTIARSFVANRQDRFLDRAEILGWIEQLNSKM